MLKSGAVALALSAAVVGAGLLAIPGSAQAQSAPSQVTFTRDVAPILQKSCIECHGPDKEKGGLRLDTKELALKGGKGGVSIVSGKVIAAND